MCGIAGIVTANVEEEISFAALENMAAMLRHRGPDEHGYFRTSQFGLAHTRLSIVDIESGQQPMSYDEQKLWISFNGEIFNHLELRLELEKRGAVFTTHSDTEVILACYRYYGEKTWGKLNGQFAFALLDLETRRLHLVRDRLGILPLHYTRSDDGRFLFASEIKALLCDPYVRSEFSAEGLSEVMCFWSAQSPQTIFENVHSVKPGSCLTLNEHLQQFETPYWQIDFSRSEALVRLDDNSLSEALEEKLSRAVALRLRADVPVGSYLSGGLDSSLICHSIRQQHEGELATYAIGFADKRFDESPQQQQMASFLETKHHSIICDDHAIAENLGQVIWHCETPLTRTSPVPLYLLSALVRDNNMKVVMTGEGADELLAGYNIFKEDKIRRFWAKQATSSLRPRLLSKLYPYINAEDNKNALWINFFKQGFQETDAKAYSHRLRWGNGSWAWRFLNPDHTQQRSLQTHIEKVCADLPSSPDISTQSQAQQLEIATFMSNYLLPSQGDRVAMANGVEIRYPFLDPDVVDFCCQIPDKKILSGLKDKRPLRKIGARKLPQSIWQRPKQPYRAPVTTPLFAGGGSDELRDLLSPESLKNTGLWDSKRVSLLADKAYRRNGEMSGEREEMAMLSIVTTQLLHRAMNEEFADRLQENLTLLKKQACRVRVNLSV